MTNDDLYAAIIALKEATELGFAAAAHRADGMDARFDQMDARFDRVDMRLGRLETRVEALEDGIVAVRADIADLKRRAR
jgi:hypothetical protein